MLLSPDLWVGGCDTLPGEVLVSGIDASPIILRALISTHCLMIHDHESKAHTLPGRVFLWVGGWDIPTQEALTSGLETHY